MGYRKRTKGDLTDQSYPITRKITDSAGNVTYEGMYGTPVHSIGEEQIMTDHVTPNFRSRSSRGEVIVNEMVQTKTSLKIQPAATLGWRNPDWGQAADDFGQNGGMVNYQGTSHLVTSVDVENLRVLAGTQAAASVQSPAFQGIVFIAELREIVQMVRKPLASYHKMIDRAAKDKRRRHRYKVGDYPASNLASFISDNWLAYRYGVRPAINDMNNFVSALEQLVKRDPPRLTARGFASDLVSLSEDLTIPAGAATFTTSRETTEEVKVRAGITYEQTGQVSNFGLNFQQLPSAVWEVIPYSFVADWFANIGSYIEAMSPKVGVRVKGKWTTTESVVSTIEDSERSYNAPYITVGNGAVHSERVNYTKIRERGVSVGLAYKPTPFKGDIGQKRVIDTFALAAAKLATVS